MLLREVLKNKKMAFDQLGPDLGHLDGDFVIVTPHMIHF